MYVQGGSGRLEGQMAVSCRLGPRTQTQVSGRAAIARDCLPSFQPQRKLLQLHVVTCNVFYVDTPKIKLTNFF